MLNGDASVYQATHFRSRRDALLKQRETDRANLAGGVTDFQAGVNRVGYLGMFQPNCDFMVGLARAHAEAVQKAYELDGQPLTEAIINNEIMPEVKELLSETFAGVFSSERGRMELEQQRTGKRDASISAKLGSLTRHFNALMRETEQAIHNDVTLHMLETKKENGTGRKRGAVLPAGEYSFHPEIQRVSHRLFLEGNFRQAVLDAFIHVIATVKELTGLDCKNADDLMNRAFCPDNTIPTVRFNPLKTIGEKNEQRGIWNLFKGVVGLRNYKAHVVTPFDGPHRAHEYLALASLLMRLLDSATIEKPKDGAVGS